MLAVRLLRRPSAAVFGPDCLLLVVTTGGLTVLNARTCVPLHTAAIAGQCSGPFSDMIDKLGRIVFLYDGNF